MAKIFELEFLFESLSEDTSFMTKRMFGCLAAYYAGKMVALLAENPGDREYRGESYDFDIWNGVLLPTEREHHPSLQQEFSDLKTHPVLGKWLYLPISSPNFETDSSKIFDAIQNQDERFGIWPKTKIRRKARIKPKRKVTKKAKTRRTK